MKNLFLSLSILMSLFCIAHDNTLLTDLITGRYNAQKMADVVWLEGERYAQLQNNTIFAYDYKKKEPLELLFAIDSINGTNMLSKDNKIQGFVVSPNERYILLYTNKQQVYRRSFVAQYYIFDTKKNTIKLLCDDFIQDPVFSPDSRYIAFGRNNNIFIHKLDFGTEVAVTNDGKVGSIINGTTDWLYEEEFGITYTYVFSPDSKQLAFVRFDESNVPSFTWQEMLGTRYPTSYSLKYPKAGEENSQVSVLVYDTYYKSLKTMKIGEMADNYIPRLKWTNSADALAIFKMNRNQNKLEMYLANPKSTESKLVYKEENKKGFVDYAQIDEWQWLSNGSFLVVNETSGYRHVYQYSATGKQLKQLTQGQYDVTYCYGYSELTGTLYFQAANQNPMTRNLFALNVKKNKLVQISSGDGWHDAVFSPSLTHFIDIYQSLTHATSYTLCTDVGKKVLELQDNNDIEQAFKVLNLPEKTFFKLSTERGDTLNAWMLLPPDFDDDNQYPVLQVQYSGPGSQQVYSKWKKDWEYFLATQGIIVVCVDPRGTYARGKDWQNLTYMNIGVMEAQDQVSLAKYMQSLPYVKADKIGIWGWSYGGFMTLMSMSQPEGVFCCGIAVAPVTDFRLYDSAYTERFMRRPQSNSAYKNCALPLMAEQLKGRLLLCHGIADDNVHCQQTWQYIDALVQAGIQFEMQLYPDDNHFLRKRNNYQHLYERKWRFLQQELLQ